MRVAAIDVGTNTCLLLIADVTKDGKIEKVIHDEAHVVRLGQGVAKSKKFHPEALQRAEDSFREFARTINSSKVDRTMACATSAARDVSNAQALIDLGTKYKIPVEIISGEEEAELTFRGTIDDVLTEPVAIIDVGGGSTEFILGDATGILVRTSIDIGSVRLTETFVTEHPIPPEQMEKLHAYITEQLKGLKEKINAPDGTRVIAVAGTPTTLAAMDQGFAFDSKRVQGHTLTNERLKFWLDRLADMGVQERRAIAGMDSKRADVIVAGAMILLMSSEAFGSPKLDVSTKGLRYGIAKMLAMHAVIAFTFFAAFTLPSAAHALPAINDQRIEKLKTVQISVGGKSVTAEIADTPDSRERGLMYRTSMPAQDGMLFIFDEAQPMAFWMKNTLIPLSIGYFGADKKLIEVYEMSPSVMGEVRPKTYPSHGAALFALEMNKGWFAKYHIKPGAELKISTTTTRH